VSVLKVAESNANASAIEVRDMDIDGSQAKDDVTDWKTGKMDENQRQTVEKKAWGIDGNSQHQDS
jgi:hypothetical protein